MKTQNRIFKLLLLILITFALACCSKKETAPQPVPIVDTDQDGIADASDDCPNEAGPVSNSGCPLNEVGEIVESDGIEKEDLETYQGAIGIVVDARNIAKKGYSPKTVKLTIDATSGDYSQTVQLDPFSFLGQIKLELEDLGEDAITELMGGVSVMAEFFNESETSIFNESLGVQSFQSNPNPTKVNVNDLEDLNTDIILNPNTTYYMQGVDANGVPQPWALRNRNNSNQFNGVLQTFDVDFNGSNEEKESLAQFYFEQESSDEFPNRFRIRQKGTNTYLRSRAVTANDGTVYEVIQSGFGENTFTGGRFNLEKVKDGVYRLQPNDGASNYGFTEGVGLTKGGEGDIFIRLISTTIDWEVQNVGTTFLEPILGEAKTDFKANSILTNCGQGSLSQTTGVTITEKENGTVGWEESLSINTTNTVDIGATIGVEFDATFFGTGATYSASMSLDYGYSRSVTESSSNFEEKSQEVGTESFTERTVTVPSGSASLVYDAFQFYENTKVNFVQRLRIRGVDSQTGVSLSGDEIRSQFQFSGFNGVISAVEPTSIVVTLRGTKVLDRIIESENKVEDVAANCGG